MDKTESILLRVDELQQEYHETNSRIDDRSNQISNMKEQLIKLEADLTQIEQETELYDVRNIELEFKKCRLDTEVDENMIILSRLQTDNKACRSSLIQKEKSLFSLLQTSLLHVDEVGTSLKEIPSIMKELQEKKQELTATKMILEETRCQRIAREQELFDAAKRNKELMRACITFEERLESLKREENMLHYQLNGIHSQIQEEECSNANSHRMIDSQLMEVQYMLQITNARLNEAQLMISR